jgi:uncharacterized protein
LRIAVIGAGIGGLSAAWLLSERHDVDLYEKQPRLGGHSNTVDVDGTDGSVAIDTGFIVYNTACYPNLIALFHHFGVATSPTDMGFAVSLDGGRYEYSGAGFNGYFGQRSNLMSPSHWRMASDIMRFFRDATQLSHDASANTQLTLGSWLTQRGYSRAFQERHIIPMGAAIWSAPLGEILNFPAAAYARFFANHGLLQMSGRPQWRTVTGGSRNYVAKLNAAFKGRVLQNEPVSAVARHAGGVTVTTQSGASEIYDRCLIATHGDEALALLSDASADERALLGAFRYAGNDTILHTDANLMPKRRRVWSSWNYIGASERNQSAHDQSRAAAISYWMNALQPLGTADDYFVSLNPRMAIDERKVLCRFHYHHPLFDEPALSAQKRLWSLQGSRNTWFAGSYFGFGFHEDALQAGLAAAEDLGSVKRPWQVEGENNRMTFCERPQRMVTNSDLQNRPDVMEAVL